MKTIINQPYALNEIGGRSNNEDSIYPPKGEVGIDDNLFLVCDGVGGNDKGEVASQLVCEAFSFYFNEKPLDDQTLFDKEFVTGALEYAQGKIDDYLMEHPEAQGMGTTLTLLHLNSQGATIAHVGDSRVYQLRDGKIIFKTDDHSLVNQLVKDGMLTEEEALTHPKKNIITRAIQGNSVKPTVPDVFVQNDVQKGDYFFLCTDGILEQITDSTLEQIIAADTTDEEKINEIDLRCKGKTRDNYSCYMVPIKDVITDEEVDENNELETDDIPMGTIIEEGNIEKNEIKVKTKKTEEKTESFLEKFGNSFKKFFKRKK